MRLNPQIWRLGSRDDELGAKEYNDSVLSVGSDLITGNDSGINY